MDQHKKHPIHLYQYWQMTEYSTLSEYAEPVIEVETLVVNSMTYMI